MGRRTRGEQVVVVFYVKAGSRGARTPARRGSSLPPLRHTGVKLACAAHIRPAPCVPCAMHAWASCTSLSPFEPYLICLWVDILVRKRTRRSVMDARRNGRATSERRRVASLQDLGRWVLGKLYSDLGGWNGVRHVTRLLCLALLDPVWASASQLGSDELEQGIDPVCALIPGLMRD